MNNNLNYFITDVIEPLSKNDILNIISVIKYYSKYYPNEGMKIYYIEGKNWIIKFSFEEIYNESNFNDIIIHTEFYPITNKYNYLHFKTSNNRLYQDINMPFLNLEKNAILKEVNLI